MRSFDEILAFLAERSRIQAKAGLDVRVSVIDKNEHSAIVAKESWKGKRLVYKAYYWVFNKAVVKQREVPFYYGCWDFVCPTIEQVKYFVEKFAPLVLKERG